MMKLQKFLAGILIFAITLFLGACDCNCGPEEVIRQISVGYQPPLIPISISVGSDGQVSVASTASINTPVGTFFLTASTTLSSLRNLSDERLLIVRVNGEATVYSLEYGKNFQVEFADDGVLYSKVALTYESDGDIILELESVQQGVDYDLGPIDEGTYVDPKIEINEPGPGQEKIEISSDAQAVEGVWYGTYHCNQGVTSLVLEISTYKGKNLRAVFYFSEHPDNPGVPSGSFNMEGYIQPSGEVYLEGTSWIDAPTGWTMVDLIGYYSAPNIITGEVRSTSRGCTDFELTK